MPGPTSINHGTTVAELSLQDQIGRLLSEPLLQSLDQLYPSRLPSPGTPMDTVRDMIVQRAVIDGLWNLYRSAGGSPDSLEVALQEHFNQQQA